MIVSIVNLEGKFLYCALREAITELPQGQIMVDLICTLETESEIFFNFDANEFYTK
jgi:hypothetical protein